MKRLFLNLILSLVFGVALFRGASPAWATVTNAANTVSYSCLTSDPTTYSITFPYIAASSDLTVTSTTAGGVVTSLAYSTDWTAPVSTTSTATLTLVARASCPTGSTLKISRVVAYKQPTSFRTQGTYDPNALERALDRLEMQIQQIASGPYTSGANLTSLGGMSVYSYGLTAPAGNAIGLKSDNGNQSLVLSSAGLLTLSGGQITSSPTTAFTLRDGTTAGGGVTSFKLNSTATKSAGLLFDLQNNGTSMLSVNYLGKLLLVPTSGLALDVQDALTITQFSVGATGSVVSGHIAATGQSGTNATGLTAVGDGTGAGIQATAGASATYGVDSTGTIRGTGTGTNPGMTAVAGGGNASGIGATGAGTGGGIYGTGGANGPGVYAAAGGGNSPVVGSVNLVPTTNAPSAAVNGDLWITTGTAPPVFGVKAGNTSYNLLGGMIEFESHAYNAANIAGGTAFSQSFVTAASTITYASMVHNIAGAGAGTFVAKLCSDGATCAGGNIYLTCTVGANCATAVAGRIDSCTITKAAVPAATTLTWSVTTACGTTNPGINFSAHLTTP